MAFMFENLSVYKKALELAENIYVLNKKIDDREIKDQIKRAALSIPLNIAEGNGRNTAKEKAQFYKIARGSLFECVPLLEICLRLSRISKSEHDRFYALSEEIGKMLNGLIKSVENKSIN
ncbi:MAG: four helix bundle protein [Candidatus Margulisbacteria bacterium]|nr:four helix bundle protein [Candidatus Margulisiibacteriota bacterium]